MQGDPNDPPNNYLVSKIDFPESGIPEFNFATAADIDPIKECPMESLPRDLATAVNQLVDRVKANVMEIKAIQGSSCASLANRLDESRTLVGTAMTYQFMTGVATQTQALTNSSTMRAGALSSLVATASNVVDQNCLSSLTEAVTIQKLIGQVITLGGIFAGGWEGVGIASIGMLISNLPLFKSDIEHTLEMITKYQEINKRGSFLCLYRQMQRTSCLLFAPSRSETINGFDLSFKTGPARQTLDTLEEISSTEKGSFLLHDLKVMRHLVRSAEPFLAAAKTTLFKEASVDSFDRLKEWCRTSAITISSFQFPDIYPKSILESLLSLSQKCEKITEWQWEGFFETGNTLNATIWNSFRELYILSDYYNTGAARDKNEERPKVPRIGLQGPVTLTSSFIFASSTPPTEQPSFGPDLKPDYDVKTVINTLESQLFFNELKEKIESFHNPSQGNQERLNYLTVTETVGQKFAKGTFKDFMKKDNVDFSRRRWFQKTLRRDLEVRKKAISAMLGVCQMFDPTLACLYANRPDGDAFFNTWKKQCVGSDSRLCSFMIERSEMERLLPNPKEKAYFESLCGIKTWLKGRN